jgi:predicted CoA-binding protein
MSNKTHIVAVLGASAKPERYSNMAIHMLREYDHQVIPVHPKLDEIDGIPVVKHLGMIKERVDTLTLYVGPARSAGLADDIIALKPGRVIFNPGTESPELENLCLANDIPILKACTLVMLRCGQF